MIELGYKLSSEEHSPLDLIQHARRAEEVGFSFAMISDHYHPWVDSQGQSPFVWNVIGGISQVTKQLRIGTGVTCPTVRIHPAIIAQAAATTAAMLPNRFILGLGSGENLNEHILGDHWAPAEVRHEMLEEAVEIIRLLWQGKQESFYGNYYTVENARLYTLPDGLPPIMIAASGEKAAELAGRIGDGLIAVQPDAELVKTFKKAGGEGKPCYGELTVCWAEDEQEARQTAYTIWPLAAFKGELFTQLPVPAHFEQAAQMIDEEAVAKEVICGNDPQKHLEGIQKYIDAGFDFVWVHQVGADQEGFFQFYQREILPHFHDKQASRNKKKAKSMAK